MRRMRSRKYAPRRGFLLLLASMGVVNAGTDASLTVDEGTWLSVDSSPADGRLAFDVLGRLFTLDPGGGDALPLLVDDAFDAHPMYSPDGRRIAFISDRSGSENLWVAEADGTQLGMLSHDTQAVFVGPAWSADASAIYVTRINDRNRRNSGVKSARWKFSLTGSREMLGLDPDLELSEIHGAAPTKDGRALYFSARRAGGVYDIYRRDLRFSTTTIVVSGRSRAAGVMQPTPSPDGRLLAYAVDIEGGTELRVRSLDSGTDRRVAYPIEMSLAASQHAYQGVLPHFAFTPDSAAIVIGYGGKLRRVDVGNGDSRIIAFRARIDARIQPSVHQQPVSEAGPVRARVIEGAEVSPDGQHVAFSAFGKVFVAVLGEPRSRRVSKTTFAPDDVSESYPTWSPDGRWLAYTTWSRKVGGHLWRIRLNGGEPQRLSRFPAFYSRPAFAPDGQSIIALRSATDEEQHVVSVRGDTKQRLAARELIRISLREGVETTLGYVNGGFNTSPVVADSGRLRFDAGGTAVFVHTPGGLMQFPLAGSASEVVWRITGPKATAFSAEVDDAAISPDGRWALALHNFQLFLVPLPADGGSGGVISLSDPAAHVRQLTEIGADEFAWSRDGARVTWSVGSTVYSAALADVLRSGVASRNDCMESSRRRWEITATLPRDIPRRQLVLRGATVVTMAGKGDGEIGDVVIADNRLAAVILQGGGRVSSQAIEVDVSGKFITPGFVDTHAHYDNTGKRNIEYDTWELPMALAYGVTTSLDPQSSTPDLFVYQDLIDAGIVKGPRAYTTGPGIFQWSGIDGTRKASCILTRYRKHYRTGIVKSYLIGSRQQRQYMAVAARRLGLMVVTENWGAPRYAITQALDGFSTNEHASDAIDYYDDMAQLYSRAGIGYSPTTLVGGEAGLPALAYFLSRRDILQDEKLNRLMPRAVIVERLRDVQWAPRSAFIFDRLAASAARIFRAGGHVGVGSHGELQGLGYHWEMEALAAGGLTPHEVLQMATRSSAAVVGRADDVGTLEAGKYADLLIFDANPARDLGNLSTLRYVIKNGRIYSAQNLAEVRPADIQ